jgi:hypothetical protein
MVAALTWLWRVLERPARGPAHNSATRMPTTTRTRAKAAPKKQTGTRPQRHATLQRAFLDSFAVTGNITRACKAAGIQRSTVWRWQEHDAAFAVAFGEAEVAATEYLEGVAFDRATATDQPSDRLLEFLLRARAPHKYATQRSETTTSGTLTIEYVNNWRSLPAD